MIAGYSSVILINIGICKVTDFVVIDVNTQTLNLRERLLFVERDVDQLSCYVFDLLVLDDVDKVSFDVALDFLDLCAIAMNLEVDNRIEVPVILGKINLNKIGFRVTNDLTHVVVELFTYEDMRNCLCTLVARKPCS